MLGKKATFIDMIFSPLFETILALGVVMTYLLWFISSTVSNTSFEKSFLATDIALSVDAMMLFPGNLDIIYSPYKQEIKNLFDFDFLKDRVEVFEGSNDKNKGIYYYSPKKDIYFNEKTIDSKDPNIMIRFSKTGNDFLISDIKNESRSIDFNQIHCPNTKVEIPDELVIDAGHGYNPTSAFSDTGFVSNNIRESELNRQLAFSLLNTAKNFFNTKLTRELEPSQANPDIENAVFINDRLNKIKSSHSFFLSFHLGNYSDKNYIKAFIDLNNNFDKSFKLACEIINQVSSALINNNFDINGISIIPIDSSLSRDKHLEILNTDNIGVLLEIGSIKNPIVNNTNIIIISQAIIEGIKNAR